MSDRLNNLGKLKFQSQLILTSNCISFVNRKDTHETNIAVSLRISYAFLKELHNAKSIDSELAYTDIVNSQVESFQLQNCPRLEGRFRRLCSDITSKYKVKGRKRGNLDLEFVTLAVYKHELQNIRYISCKLEAFRSEKVALEQQCRDLLSDLSSILSNANELSAKETEIESLKKTNKELLDHIEKIQHHCVFVNQGTGDIDELGNKQFKRKLTELKSHASQALWFAETFGLLPKKLTLATKTGKPVCLDFDDKENVKYNYQSLHSEDKERLKQLVYLLDTFCVSDAAYHELAMFYPEMPRKYLIVQCRNDLNSTFHIEQVPGNVPGAMLSVRQELVSAVRSEISRMECSDLDTLKFQVKFSGDGAKVSRISNFVAFSFNIISDEKKLSSHEQKTVAILKCSEDYCDLRLSCKPIFEEVNSVVREK